MNDTKFGLTGVFCSNDEPAAVSLLRKLDVGTAYVNAVNAVSPLLSWGGRRASGVGVSLAQEDMLSFLKTKSMYLRR